MALILEQLDGMTRWCSTVQCGLQAQTHTELWTSSPIFTRLLIGNTRAPFCQRATQAPLNLIFHHSSIRQKKLLNEISDVTLFWVFFPSCVSTRTKTYHVTGHLKEVLWQKKNNKKMGRIVLSWSTAMMQWGMLTIWGAAVQHTRIFTYCWFVFLGWYFLCWCLQLTKWLRPVQCHYQPSWDKEKSLMY